MKRVIILYFILSYSNIVFGQNEKFESVKSIIDKIESKEDLTKTIFDYHELNPSLITKGSTLEVWYGNGQIFKIKEWFPLSWGVFIGVTYFLENKPIKYLEIEKNFETEEKDHTKTIEVFKLEYYYLDCDSLLDCTKVNGKRIHSSGEIKYVTQAHLIPLKYAKKALKNF